MERQDWTYGEGLENFCAPPGEPNVLILFYSYSTRSPARILDAMMYSTDVPQDRPRGLLKLNGPVQQRPGYWNTPTVTVACLSTRSSGGKGDSIDAVTARAECRWQCRRCGAVVFNPSRQSSRGTE